ncbi:MAG: hypothetical protein ABFR95_04150 [Actinomycetota bacterium]
MEYTLRNRWLWLALSLALAAAMLALVSSPASARQPSRDVDSFMELMSDTGHEFAGEAEALEALAESGIPVDVAIEMLEQGGVAAADYFLPLIIEVIEELPTRGAALTPSLDEMASAVATECDSQSTKVDLKGGASGITVLWHRLASSHCFDGSIIVGTPTATVSSGRTSYGLAMGYRWTSTPQLISSGWITYQKQYRFKEEGTYQICPVGLPYCYGGSDPWIQHDKYYSGSSIARYGL